MGKNKSSEDDNIPFQVLIGILGFVFLVFGFGSIGSSKGIPILTVVGIPFLCLDALWLLADFKVI